MKHFTIQITQDDADSMLRGETPSQDVLAQVYASTYRAQLEQFNHEELRDEIERVLEPEVIIDFFFHHVLVDPTCRTDMVNILHDIAFDTYEFKPTNNQ